MQKCKICGSRLEDGAETCKVCGANINDERPTTVYVDAHSLKTKCPFCGVEILGEHAYCPTCGERLNCNGMEAHKIAEENLVCRDCGNPIDSKMNFCPTCGVKILKENLVCRDCGEPIDSKMNFCPNCGAKILKEKPENSVNPINNITEKKDEEIVSQKSKPNNNDKQDLAFVLIFLGALLLPMFFVVMCSIY